MTDNFNKLLSNQLFWIIIGLLTLGLLVFAVFSLITDYKNSKFLLLFQKIKFKKNFYIKINFNTKTATLVQRAPNINETTVNLEKFQEYIAEDQRLEWEKWLLKISKREAIKEICIRIYFYSVSENKSHWTMMTLEKNDIKRNVAIIKAQKIYNKYDSSDFVNENELMLGLNEFKIKISELIESGVFREAFLISITCNRINTIKKRFGIGVAQRFSFELWEKLGKLNDENNIVARVSDDTFIIFTDEMKKRNDISGKIKKIHSQVGHIISFEEYQFDFNFIIGYTKMPPYVASLDSYIRGVTKLSSADKKLVSSKISYYESSEDLDNYNEIKEKRFYEDILTNRDLDLKLVPFFSLNSFAKSGYLAKIYLRNNKEILFNDFINKCKNLDLREKIVNLAIDEFKKALTVHTQLPILFYISLNDFIKFRDKFLEFKRGETNSKFVLVILDYDQMIEYEDKDKVRAAFVSYIRYNIGIGIIANELMQTTTLPLLKRINYLIIPPHLFHEIDSFSRKGVIISNILERFDQQLLFAIAENVEKLEEIEELKYLGVNNIQGKMFNECKDNIFDGLSATNERRVRKIIDYEY